MGFKLPNLQGVPTVVLNRAKAILNELDGKESYQVSTPKECTMQVETAQVVEETVTVQAPEKLEAVTQEVIVEDNTLVAEKATAFEVTPQAVETLHQINLFEAISNNHEPVIEKLRGLDVMRMTPIEALETLYDLQKQLR